MQRDSCASLCHCQSSSNAAILATYVHAALLPQQRSAETSFAEMCQRQRHLWPLRVLWLSYVRRPWIQTICAVSAFRGFKVTCGHIPNCEITISYPTTSTLPGLTC